MSLSLLAMIALNGMSPDSMDAYRLSLEASSASWFALVKYSGYAVAFGCALEAPETLVILKRWYLLRFKGQDREETLEDKRGWIVPLAAIGLLVIVAGIVLETYGEGKVSDIDALIRSHESDKITAAESAAGAAIAKAADANSRAADNENEAAQLGKRTEDERLARVKIEAAVAFRRLTPRQKEALGNGVARFKGLVGVSFWYQASDIEGELFADDIAEALRAKGAIVQPPANLVLLRNATKFGDPIVDASTGVVVQSTKIGAAPEFADAIVKELNLLGFDANRQTNPPFEKGTDPTVWVTIEARPKGPQGEYKLHPISKK